MYADQREIEQRINRSMLLVGRGDVRKKRVSQDALVE
jgi:hypothetical protein